MGGRVDDALLPERRHLVRSDAVPPRPYFRNASRRGAEIDGRGEADVEKLGRKLFGNFRPMFGIRLFVDESEFFHFRKFRCRHRCGLNEFPNILGGIRFHGRRRIFGFRPDTTEDVYAVLLERYVLDADEGLASERIDLFPSRILSVRIMCRRKVAVPRPLPFFGFRFGKTREPVGVACRRTLVRPSFERKHSVHGKKEIPLCVEIGVGHVFPNRYGVRFELPGISGNDSDFGFADLQVLGVRAHEVGDPVPYGIRNPPVRSFEYFSWHSSYG